MVRLKSPFFLSVLLILAVSSPLGARPAQEAPPGYGRVPDPLLAHRPPHLFSHNVGLLTLRITNLGIIGNPYINEISAGWRGDEYLYQSSLWVGARGSDGEAHVSMSQWRDLTEFRPQLDVTWTVYESFEGMQGGVRVGSQHPSRGDDDGDGLVDEDFHNGLDDDGDGRIDEDFSAIGQQMLSCMYRDDTPEAVSQIPDHYPLNLLVRQRSFQWSTGGINEFVGFDFEIVNIGDQRLKDLYLGFFSDSDAGPKTTDLYWTDDLVGWAQIDTTIEELGRPGSCREVDLQMETAFMWDAPDAVTGESLGDVDGVFGTLFLGHTTDDTGLRAPQNVGLNTVAWFSASGEETDPQNDDERYALLSRNTKPNRNANKPDDYRYVISAGPFAELNPGQSLRFQTAYVIGEGQIGFRKNAVGAQRVFNGRFLDLDGNKETGVGGKERCLQILETGTHIIWDDPCDTLVVPEVIRATPPCDIPGPHYVDADCDACTGTDGKETLVNWVGTIAPPPPSMNTDPMEGPSADAFVDPAGDRKIIIQWNNLSELFPDPLSGEEIFEGYRIWRVDNWQRPEGSLGPRPEEWMKIAEFRLHPEAASQEGAESLLIPFPGGPLVRMTPIGSTDTNPPKSIFPVGRYRYEDTRGLLNGKLYFYAVTAFGLARVTDPVTGRDEIVELASTPNAIEIQGVVPRWDAREGCDRVSVVPNPYRGSAAWDLVPSDRDPTGAKIAFRNLPRDMSTIRIYTLSGDLVKEVQHNGLGGDGTYFWNMISRNGQVVVSGVYIFSVRHPGGVCRGRFVIIR